MKRFALEKLKQWKEKKNRKPLIIRGARQDVGQLYPNREWGYGKLDLARTFLILAGLS